MRRRQVERIVGVAAALLVCGWFVLGARQAHDVDLATAIVSGSGPISAARASDAAALLREAGQLDPDSTVDLLRSQLQLRLGHLAQARAIALAVARREPQNIEAWAQYGSAASNDRQAFQLALHRLRALAPPVSASG
jgi:hypothetical protein